MEHWQRVCDMPAFDEWFQNKTQRLKVTYHAGEDYLHPLCGLRTIHDAIVFCKSDRVGHGLALGADIEDFNQTRGQFLWMPKGLILDDLLWLCEFCIPKNPPAGKNIFNHLLGCIEKLSTQIYGVPLTCAAPLVALRKLRNEVAFSNVCLGLSDVSRQLLLLDLSDSETAKNKGQPIDVRAEYPTLFTRDFCDLFVNEL
jgi:hypothetical protein